MQCDIRCLTWDDIERAVKIIAQKISGVESIYGEPRGGLIPAILLSHELGFPLVCEPTDTTLWVDDIVDSGDTYKTATAKGYKNFASVVVREQSEQITHGVIIEAGWIVFPWEKKTKAQKDMMNYLSKRPNHVPSK